MKIGFLFFLVFCIIAIFASKKKEINLKLDVERRCAMLNDFTWNMTGYIPKYAVNPHGDGIIPYMAERIFQLEPEPPAVGSLNEYILSALREKNLIYFSFFLHHYEPQLNKRSKGFWGVDGGDLYDTDCFIDIKLSCREQMLQKLMDYDPAKGAEYATYIFPFIRMLCSASAWAKKNGRYPL